MAEKDNNRPISNGSQGTPAKSFATNNVKSTIGNSNHSRNATTESANSKTTQKPTKKR